jgi:hypothetical protein
VRLLGSENFEERENAVQELIKVGAPALEALRKASASTDAEVARLAKNCIQKIEHNVKVADWLRQVREGKEKERQEASGYLIRLGPQLDEVIPPLVELLDHPKNEVKEAVAYILETTGIKAKVALPKLLRILADNTPGTHNLRLRVIGILEQIGPSGRQGVPILLKILETEDWEMMACAAQGLAALGQDDPRVGPALLKALSHEDLRVKDVAAGALADLRKEHEKAVPAIMEILKTYPFRTEEDMKAKYAFVRHLGAYGPLAEPAIPYLIRVWKDERGDGMLREAAKMALVAVGPPAHKAIPGLKELGKTPSDYDFYELIKKLDRK